MRTGLREARKYLLILNFNNMGKIYKANGEVLDIEPKNGTDFQLEELQAIVGGLIDCQMTNDGNDLIIFNDEGKLMELPYNENATEIYQERLLGMSYKTRMGNRMENSGLKIIYLDIMVKDRFVTQIPYPHCTLFPIDSEELKIFVLEKRPSLKNKDFRIEFSNNKVK